MTAAFSLADRVSLETVSIVGLAQLPAQHPPARITVQVASALNAADLSSE